MNAWFDHLSKIFDHKTGYSDHVILCFDHFIRYFDHIIDCFDHLIENSDLIIQYSDHFFKRNDHLIDCFTPYSHFFIRFCQSFYSFIRPFYSFNSIFYPFFPPFIYFPGINTRYQIKKLPRKTGTAAFANNKKSEQKSLYHNWVLIIIIQRKNRLAIHPLPAGKVGKLHCLLAQLNRLLA